MSVKHTTVIDDLKAIKGYLTGVVAFAVAIGTFLVNYVHLPSEASILTIAGLAVAMSVIGFLISRSERRQQDALASHVVASDKVVTEMRENMLENARSNLRVEMNLMMYLKPENHDTILKMAHRYFVELKGDWVETDEFGAWLEREENAGRKVHVPSGLAAVVADLQAKE